MVQSIHIEQIVRQIACMELIQQKLFLIGPRIDLTLTDKIFLTTYYQYNNLQRNLKFSIDEARAS